MSKGLTIRQSEIIDFIQDYIHKNSYPPTLKEIGQNFKISLKGSYDHIKALQKKKYLDYQPKKRRSIKLLVMTNSNDHKLDEIPVLGTVQAGLPILSYENFEGSIKIDKNMFEKGKLFALKIRGDSMIDEGINEDDIAIIKHIKNFENGETIVIETENGFTLKKGYIEDNRLRLEAANKNYKTIYSRNPRIIGKLVGLVRKY